MIQEANPNLFVIAISPLTIASQTQVAKKQLGLL
jgi:hypothetical protein